MKLRTCLCERVGVCEEGRESEREMWMRACEREAATARHYVVVGIPVSEVSGDQQLCGEGGAEAGETFIDYYFHYYLVQDPIFKLLS